MVRGETFGQVYAKMAREVLYRGEEVSPRGMKTKELIQETFCIENPSANLIYIDGRNFSLMHAIAEAFLISTKNNVLASYTLMNPRMSMFSDNGVNLHGAYGYRIADDLKDIVSKLYNDHDTRQAVVNIYSIGMEYKDLQTTTKDVPCTLCLQFTIRDGKLNMHVYMRSNDIIWGTPYDVYVFTNLLQVMANELGIPVGKYYHTATSLHCYENMFQTLEMIESSSYEDVVHVNKNTLSEWKSAAHVFTQIAMGAFSAFEQKQVLDNFDHDGSYSRAVLTELAWREAKDQKVKLQSEVSYIYKTKALIGEDKNYKWLRPFTKRWFRDEFSN